MTCCHRTRLRGAPCPEGRVCPWSIQEPHHDLLPGRRPFGDTLMPTHAEKEALLKHPLHAWGIGDVSFGFRRSDDGLWHEDGRVLPWFCFLPWINPKLSGGKVKIGKWIFGLMWGGR